MGIRVICPGCMRRFEVSERFAGKKGPCPKCGHMIEIPKENVVIHAPDEIIIEGKKVKNPDFVRPIEREAFAFTRKQIVANIIGMFVILAFAWLFHFLGSGPLKWMAGTAGIFVVAFELAKAGYILVRDPDDLEIFLGRELFRKSCMVALGYVAAWLIFEALIFFLNPGFFFFFYLVPIAALAAFIPLIVFDTDFGDSFMLFVIFALCVTLIRGMMFYPDGWIWKPIPPIVREKVLEEIPVSADVSVLPEGAAQPVVKSKLDKKAPDASEALNR